MDKQTLRARMLGAREALSAKRRENAARQIEEQLFAAPFYRRAEAVYLYMDHGGEVPTGGILRRVLMDGKKAAVPKICGDEMRFVSVCADTVFEKDRFGIRTPVSGAVCEDRNALVLVPGVAFGRNGERIGYGGGFYDRYLRAHPDCFTVGLCYRFQVAEQIETLPHDVPVRMLLCADP